MKPSRAELAAVGLILAYNYAVHRLLPSATHVPGNLTAAAILVAIARYSGATWEQIGLEPENFVTGLAVGTRYALPAAAIVAAGVASPRTRPVFTDDRVIESSPIEAAYNTTLRIPLATALGEELMFRGALPAILAQRRSRAAATAVSSLLFGVWHVLPTLESLNSNGPGGVHTSRRARRAATIAGTVAATAIAGLGFTLVRERGRSVGAPALVHTAINATGYALGRTFGRRDLA